MAVRGLGSSALAPTGGGTFRGRISEHYLLNESKMNFDASQMPPHDRSIFRKNIGRAVLNMAGDEYLLVWNIDFMPRSPLKNPLWSG